MQQRVKLTSDSRLLPTGEGTETARRLVQYDSLGATELCLEIDAYVLRFEELRSGNAMLFREGRDSDARFVAIDAYDRGRIVALIDLIAENPKAAIASIEWQEDSDGGLLGYVTVAVAIAIGAAAIYGLYVEFFR